MAVKEVGKSDFAEAVKQGVTLVDFWAPWCGPCKMLGPVIDELASEMGDQVNFVKVNVDEEQELASDYGISSIPTMYIMKDGEKVDQIVGFKPKEALEEALKKAM